MKILIEFLCHLLSLISLIVILGDSILLDILMGWGLE